MSFLVNNDGAVISSQTDILKEVQYFYENLYSEQDVRNVNLFQNIKNANKLTQEESEQLEGPLTLQEIGESLKNMKNNKSPGSDGFTVEFYKFFFADIGSFLVRSLNDGFSNQCMSVTQRQGVIVCIPKEDRPKQYLKNWRPISLLNTAYKIASASIANRIKSFLPKLIHDDQKGFMAGRYIGENIRKIYDVLHYTQEKNIPGMLLSVDFEKAFDSISWSFLNKALKFFNFGPGLIQWIFTFYNKISSCVSINGQYSNWFPVRRGVRQGDPCSPYLYLIGAEVLSLLIRENNYIKGIKVENQEILLSQFADDTNVCLDGSEQSFREIINLLKGFAQMSGLKMNFEKTNVIWIGSMKQSQIRYLRDENFCWNPGIFRILGIQFCMDLKNITNINIQGKLHDIQKILNRWSKRDLSPLGRITVLKSLIVSKLTYLFINLPDPPSEFIKELQSSLFAFLWNNKPAKIKKSVVCKSYTDGGLQMIDVKSYIIALKLTWLKRINREGSLQRLTFNLFPKFINLPKMREEYIHSCLKSCNNPFWREVLIHFKSLYRKSIPKNPAEFLSECIHYNSNIIRDHHVVFVKEWYDNNILYIHQLFNVQNNSFFTFVEFRDLYPNINNTNFLVYNGIIRAIIRYKQKLGIEFNTKNRIIETKVWKSIKEGGKIIQAILQKSNVQPSAVTKWNNVFENLNWFKIFKQYSKFHDIKLKWFQLRILHRLLPTRKYLYNCKIIDDPMCNICQVETQTIQHLFWDCEIVKKFWNDFNQLLTSKCQHCNALSLSDSLILFGYKEGTETDYGLNYILLLAKFYIYTISMTNARPTIQGFLCVLKQRCSDLKYMHSLDGTLNRYKEHWFLYQDLF